LTDGEKLLGCLQVVSLPGHTKNSVGFLDLRSKTLLSGDCLQLKGIGKYRNGISRPAEYIQSIKRLQEMDIECIVAAHEYDPLGSIADGKAEVSQYLELCLQIAQEIEKGSE
jgi:glyoxylase-like metal-dependent hydrolase (beta-lactamase superfamily II)